MARLPQRINFSDRIRGRFSWVLIGVPLDRGGVMVMASDQLGEAELEAHAEDIDVTSMLEAMRTRVSPVLTYTITCTAGGIQCVYGQTYADAILRLFDIWSPTEPEAPRSLPAQTTDQI